MTVSRSSNDRAEPIAANEQVTWVAGIGPPLEQIERDYLADQGGGQTRADVLALIAEVKRLRTIEEMWADGF